MKTTIVFLILVLIVGTSTGTAQSVRSKKSNNPKNDIILNPCAGLDLLNQRGRIMLGDSNVMGYMLDSLKFKRDYEHEVDDAEVYSDTNETTTISCRYRDNQVVSVIQLWSGDNTKVIKAYADRYVDLITLYGKPTALKNNSGDRENLQWVIRCKNQSNLVQLRLRYKGSTVVVYYVVWIVMESK